MLSFDPNPGLVTQAGSLYGAGGAEIIIMYDGVGHYDSTRPALHQLTRGSTDG